jgi:hypothetical protein
MARTSVLITWLRPLTCARTDALYVCIKYLSKLPPSHFGTNAKQKKDLLDLTSISPSDPFMGHLGICAYDLVD